jgi:hypothetical protein
MPQRLVYAREILTPGNIRWIGMVLNEEPGNTYLAFLPQFYYQETYRNHFVGLVCVQESSIANGLMSRLLLVDLNEPKQLVTSNCCTTVYYEMAELTPYTAINPVTYELIYPQVGLDTTLDTNRIKYTQGAIATIIAELKAPYLHWHEAQIQNRYIWLQQQALASVVMRQMSQVQEIVSSAPYPNPDYRGQDLTVVPPPPRSNNSTPSFPGGIVTYSPAIDSVSASRQTPSDSTTTLDMEGISRPPTLLANAITDDQRLDSDLDTASSRTDSSRIENSSTDAATNSHASRSPAFTPLIDAAQASAPLQATPVSTPARRRRKANAKASLIAPVAPVAVAAVPKNELLASTANSYNTANPNITTDTVTTITTNALNWAFNRSKQQLSKIYSNVINIPQPNEQQALIVAACCVCYWVAMFNNLDFGNDSFNSEFMAFLLESIIAILALNSTVHNFRYRIK